MRNQQVSERTASNHRLRLAPSLACWLLPLLAVTLWLALARPAQAQPGSPGPGSPGPGTPAPAYPAPTYHVVRITFAGQADANRLAGELDVWNVDHPGHTLVAYVSDQQLAALRARGYPVRVEPTAAALLDLTGPADGPSNGSGDDPTGGLVPASIPSFTCYRTVTETYAALAALATTTPTLATWNDIGDSWIKVNSAGAAGNDLFVLVVTNQDRPGPKPRLFVLAAIHARELATAELATRFAEQLVQGYGVDPDITWLLDYNEVHILAQANPDGRQRTEASVPSEIFKTNPLWRKNMNSGDGCPSPNAFGVDLNRNSSFKWGACENGFCSSTDSCNLVFRGRAAASEPETTAIQGYVRSIFADQRGPADTDAAPADATGVLISLHSYAEQVLFPWGWSATPAPNDTGLRTLARKFAYYLGYTACQAGENNCLYQTDGTTDDFSYGELGIASYTFEVGTAFYQNCNSFESDIWPSGLQSLLFAAKSARLPYQAPAGPEVVNLTVPARVQPDSVFSLTARLDDARTITIDPIFGGEAVQPIAAARYSLDAPSWDPTVVVTGSLPLRGTLDQPALQVQATLSTTGWALGRHLLFVEAQDAAGNWGPPTAAWVIVDDTPPPPPLVWHVYVPWLPNQGVPAPSADAQGAP